MKCLEILAVLLCSLFLIPHAYAKLNDADLPIYPGTTVIAGDIDENEFYIVEEKDAPKLKLALQEAAKNKAQDLLNEELAKQFIVANAKLQKQRESAAARMIAKNVVHTKPAILKVMKNKTVLAKAAKQKYKPVIKPFVYAENQQQTTERLRSALQKQFIRKNEKQQATPQRFAYSNKPHSSKDHQHLVTAEKDKQKKFVIKSVQFDKHHQLVLRDSNDL